MTDKLTELPSQSAIAAEAEIELGGGVSLAPEGIEDPLVAAGTGPWQRAARRFARNRAALVSLIVLLVLAVMAAFAPFMHTQSPLLPNFNQIDVGPSPHYWFGTDGVGRDVFSRILYALRVPFITGVLGASISILIGSTLGLVAGFHGGLIDATLARFTDLVFAFPTFILALIVVSLFGPALDPYFGGAGRVIMLSAIFALVSWPPLMRVVRSLALHIKEEPYVEAARVSGSRNVQIIRTHLMPSVIGLALVQGSFIVASLISVEAVLSIFGLGVQAPNPDLGAILNEGVQHMAVSGWEVLFPAIFLTVLILGFTFVGDGLRDAIDTSGS
jgi:ABC-type dipeptide/oligopeptide/nickel transport system permease subunit